MKIKIIKKLVFLISIIFLFNIYMLFVNRAFAISDPTENPDIWISGETEVGDDVLNSKAKPVLGIIRVFGIIASVISLAIIGIKIMFGSVEEKANYKQTLIPWAAGAIMVFAMTTIPSLVYNAIGKEKMSADIKISSGKKVSADYCINGKELDKCEYVPSSGTNVYRHSTISDCGCNGKRILDDENYKYKCPVASCGTRLEKIGKYYYCNKCGKVYE